MSQLNTLALRDALISRVTDFALDEHFVDDEALRDVLQNIWMGDPKLGGLGSDLWVEGVFPSKSADETLPQLSKRGVIHPGLVQQLHRVGVFSNELRPYTHQLASLELAHNTRNSTDAQPAIVITAGTGAGKTESFLLPLLERLWTQPPIPGGGVSAILLYPMNALVNDQVGRLDQWLEGQNHVNFFHFTSETPENARAADDRNLPKASTWRFRTRQQARGWEGMNGKKIENGLGPQPQILVTNYSMLEYMLCRPQDAVFFGSNLRAIVLDEAHIYTGNLAAEIALLLRRVQMRCGRNPNQVLHIATSATIGGGEVELRPFMSKLFTKSESLVHVITGEPTCVPLKVPPSSELLPLTLAKHLESIPDEETLCNDKGHITWQIADDETLRRWRNLLGNLAPSSVIEAAFIKELHVAPILARVLQESPALAKLQQRLWNEGVPTRLTLNELSNQLFGIATEVTIKATRSLLQLGAISRNTSCGWPLVPNRMHYLMRGPEGMMISFSSSPPGEACRYLSGRGYVFSAGADPSCCEKVEEDYPLTMMRCPESGWWGVAARQVRGKLLPVSASIILHGMDDDLTEPLDVENPIQRVTNNIKFYSLDAVPGANCWYFNPHTGEYTTSPGLGIPLWEITNCPRSGVVLTNGRVGWFSARARLQLSVVAETALAAMPEFPHSNKIWKPARGRRLLVFSDSRAEAARLGPRLTRQHEMQVFRAAVVKVLSNMSMGGNADDLAQRTEDAQKIRDQLAIPNLTPRRIKTLNEDLERVEKDIADLSLGFTVQYWIDHLRESPLINEIYHAPSGESHDPLDEEFEKRWDENGECIKNDLDKLLGRELARRPPWPNVSMETLGLVEVVYPHLDKIPIPNTLLGTLNRDMGKRLEQIWPNFLAALLDSLRNQGCVTLDSKEADYDYQFGGALLGKYFSVRHSYRRSLLPLIGENFDGPQTSRRNAFTRDLLLVLGFPIGEAIELANELMNCAFNSLLEGAESGKLDWIKVKKDAQTNDDRPAIALQLRFPRLGLRRPTSLYRCNVTGQVWPRSVLGLYPGASNPSLIEIAAEKLDDDPRLRRRRRELLQWCGFTQGLWAEEHSAQLSPNENARLQNLFRIGMRNILSSTTTMELGIDIGGLSAVLLGNLPPGKANYLQRAGRAGRRADGSCAVIGFARPTPYEREVFLDFRRYLNRDLRKPTVFLDRAAIVRRHAHAWLLGEFFRRHFEEGQRTGAMDAYGKMGAFTGTAMVMKWDSRESNKPQIKPAIDNSLASQFINYLDLLSKESLPEKIETLKYLWSNSPELEELLVRSENAWEEILDGIKREFRSAIDLWLEDVNSMTKAWRELPDMEISRSHANAIYYQLRTLYQITVIESLADARVLPRYGFPIGQCRLRVQVAEGGQYNGDVYVREEDQFRLQRDSMQAMREYAPGSQLLVGGKVVTSRGLLKHWTGAVLSEDSWGLRGRFKRSNLGYFDYSINASPPITPPKQGDECFSDGVMLFPKSGFSTAASEPPKLGSDFERVGKVEAWTIAFGDVSACDAQQFDFGGIKGCVGTYRHGGELLLLNGGEKGYGFAICQKCGYADSEWRSGGNGRVNLPTQFERHLPLNSPDKGKNSSICLTANEAPIWRNHHLAARQTTHLLRLDFKNCGVSLNQKVLKTLAQALRLAGTEMLELDYREIMVLDQMGGSDTACSSSIILYDSLAGGSGHLAQISHRDNPEIAHNWIQSTINILSVPESYPPNVRQREAVRRILTSDCPEDELLPLEALEFLLKVQSAKIEPGDDVSRITVPDNAWTLERLSNEVPSDEFLLWYPSNDIRGMDPGVYLCRKCTHMPANNQIIILRDERLQGGIAVGHWFAQLDQTQWVVKLRKHPKPITLLYSVTEFERLMPLAMIISGSNSARNTN